MSKYTPEEIEEMRKRLPFKAVVDNRHEELITIVFDDGRCANNKGVWFLFEEIKEPKYEPFTAEDFKEFAGKWVTDGGGDGNTEMIIRFSEEDIHIDSSGLTYKTALKEWRFADTGKPFGKEMKQ